MDNVYDADALLFPKSDLSIIDQVQEYYVKNYGNSVVMCNGREVLLDREGIKDSFYHRIGSGMNRFWVSAYAAVPEVIKNGVSTDYQLAWKGRAYDTEILVAHVSL